MRIATFVTTLVRSLPARLGAGARPGRCAHDGAAAGGRGCEFGRCDPCRGQAGRRGACDGGLVAASGDPGRRRHPQTGRQRGRCGGGGGLCARGRQSVLRQYRRRRIHDDPPRGRQEPVPRLSREGAAEGDRHPVPGRSRQCRARPQHRHLARRRHARHGDGSRRGAGEIRHDAPEPGDRPRDRARPPGLCARARRRGDHGPPRPAISRRSPMSRRSSSTMAVRSWRESGWSSRSSPPRSRRSRRAAPRPFIAAPSPARWPRRARPAAACSPRRISPATRRCGTLRSPAAIAATPSSPRRRQAPAAPASARSSRRSSPIRSGKWAMGRSRPPMSWSRPNAMPMPIATPTSAIPPSCIIRSRG